MAHVDTATPVPPPLLEVPAPARPALSGIHIAFLVGNRPPSSPGKAGFCMKEVFGLEGREYMMVLNGIRQIANAYRLDMMKPITHQNQTVVQRIYEKACDVFPGFKAFADQDNPQWPVEAFLMVILKSASDTRSAIRRAQNHAQVAAASPNTKARRKAARQESARRSALARSAAKRRAAEAHIDTELGFENEIEQVSQGLGEMSFKYDNDIDQGMDNEHEPVLGGSFLDCAPLSAPEPAHLSGPASAPVYAPPIPSHVRPSAAALARRPPPIPSAATHLPHQAADSLGSTTTPAPTVTSAPVGAANVTPAPPAALARLPPPIPPATSHPRPRPRPRPREVDDSLGPVPEPMPAPTSVPTPAPSPMPVLTPMSAPGGSADALPTPAPVTSTPARRVKSAATSAALASAPLAIHARVSTMLLSLGTPEVNRTLLDIDDDNLVNLNVKEPELVVGKGAKGKAKGGSRTKANAVAETLQAEPSASTPPVPTKAPRRKKIVQVPPAAPSTRTRSKNKAN
ncbi:hypothetical protein FS749_006458 [Ceratobasidium sp. UAMH 11750]|nr:hypothetical protein FS749_006458 [Ceratobasidium sp. UAMH 11750]